MRPMKRIVAALAALTMTAGLALAQTFPPGPWLPITKIAADGGESQTTVDLEWDDFSNLVGVEVWTKDSLSDPDWQLLSVERGGVPTTRFALDSLGLRSASLASQKFYRLRGVRGTGGGAPVKGDDGNWYVNVGSNGAGETVYVKVDGNGNILIPPTVWTNVLDGAVQIWPAGGGTGGGADCQCDASCMCLEKNGIVKVQPDGTVVVTRPPREPGYDGDDNLILLPDDVIVSPAPDDPIVVPHPGGYYDETIPGVVVTSVPPYTILVPSGLIEDKDEDGNSRITLPGPDGKLGTKDDVTVLPATIADVDTETGIVTVPKDSAISVDGKPIVVDGVNNDFVPPGSFPKALLCCPTAPSSSPATATTPTRPPLTTTAPSTLKTATSSFCPRTTTSTLSKPPAANLTPASPSSLTTAPSPRPTSTSPAAWSLRLFRRA